MKQLQGLKKQIRRCLAPIWVCVVISSFAATSYGQQAPLVPKPAQLSTVRPIPLMLLALPGRGAVLSAPREVGTVTVENENGDVCSAHLTTTDQGGALEIPVARTPHCPAPRIVVYR